MSMGYGGVAKLVLKDETLAIYAFDTYSSNVPGTFDYEYEFLYDGYITIDTSCLVKAEIHEKIKRMPSRRKKLIRKKVLVDVPYDELESKGLITIELPSVPWPEEYFVLRRDITCTLVSDIFDYYQMNEVLPECMGAHY